MFSTIILVDRKNLEICNAINERYWGIDEDNLVQIFIIS